MKNTRKLLSATLMLVIAFIAVAGSTYAWFTMQSEPEVEDLQVDVFAGDALTVALHDNALESEYYTNITQQMIMAETVNASIFDAKITPVTSKDENGNLRKLVIGNPSGVYEWNDALKNTDYIAFDLWIKSDKATSVYLKAASILPGTTNDTEDEAGAKSARLGFLHTDTTTSTTTFRVVEPGRTDNTIAPTTQGTYGVGDFFNETYLTQKGFTGLYDVDGPFYSSTLGPLLDPLNDYKIIEEDHNMYTIDNTPEDTLDDDFTIITNYTVPSSTAGGSNQAIVELEADVAEKVTVMIWIDGWDGDCVDDAQSAKLKFAFQFMGYTQPA